MNEIPYINTDLDLVSRHDLTDLAAALAARGVLALHVGQDGDLWRASFETERQYDDAATNIAALVAAVESLPESARRAWAECASRELNIGYDSETERTVLNDSLPAGLLTRIGSLGASLGITLYPLDVPPHDSGAADPVRPRSRA